MSATAFNLDVTEEDLTPTGNYDDFEPGDYEGVLTEVRDVEAKNTGNVGWKWVFVVDGLEFDTVTWLKGKGLWKLQEVVASLGGSLNIGGQTVDPNMYIGQVAGLKIGKDANQKDDRYKDRLTILRTFPVADAPNIFDVPEI